MQVIKEIEPLMATPIMIRNIELMKVLWITMMLKTPQKISAHRNQERQFLFLGIAWSKMLMVSYKQKILDTRFLSQ